MIQTISILGLNGNPDTLLARAEHMWNTMSSEYDVDDPFPPCPVWKPTFDQAIAHLESIGFRCVDVAGSADRPGWTWNFMLEAQGLDAPVSGETWKVILQSNLRFAAFVTVKLDGAEVEHWVKDMIRSGLWHLASINRIITVPLAAAA